MKKQYFISKMLISLLLLFGLTTNEYHAQASVGNSVGNYINCPSPNRSLDTGLWVGRTEGAASVSPTGAAIYQIPIRVPDGTNGLQPQIAVTYNSQSANNILGYGWSLAATSVIGRIGKTYYYDHTVGPILMNNTDNLVLDGKRLLLVSGTNLTSGAVYKTEIEDYSTIEFLTINSKNCFKVRTKDGTVYEYGSDHDSSIQPTSTNTTLYWLLSKVTDRNGNYMSYEYNINNTTCEFNLSKIKYTGNEYSGVHPYYSIEFNYVDRNDKIESFVAGHKVEQHSLLKQITIWAGGISKKNYIFDYIFDGYYSKLSLVTETGEGYFERYNSTVIDWGDYYQQSSKDGEEYVSSLDVSREGTYPDFVDFNGDGRVDMMSYPTKDYKEYTSSDKAVLYLANNSLNKLRYLKQCTLPLVENFIGLLYVDFDGDGKLDIARVSFVSDKNYRCDYFMFNGTSFVNTGKGFNTSESEILSGDFNGDGKTELFTKGEQNLYNGNAQMIGWGGIDNWGTVYYSSYPNNRYMVDFNGDGKTDILVLGERNIWVYTLSGTSFSRIHSFNYSEIDSRFATYPGDFNGDGKTDLLCQDLTHTDIVYLCVSTGINFKKQQIQGHDIKAKVFVSDCNSDGKAEIIHGEMIATPEYKWKLKIGTFDGVRFNNESYISELINPLMIKDNPASINQSNIAVTDLDGDGRAEFILAYHNDRNFIISFTDKQNLLVKNIIDGLDQQASFYYSSVTNLNCNKPDTNSPVFPLCRVQFPLYVTYLQISSVGQSLDQSYQYTYEDLYIHKQGKGLLGFKKIIVKEPQKLTQKISEYDYLKGGYIPLLVNQTEISKEGGLISSLSNYYTVNSLTTNRYEFLLTGRSQTDWIKELSTNETFSDFQYGNPRRIERICDVDSEIQYIAYKHVETPTIRLLGLPLTIEKQKQRGGGEVWREKELYSYDGNNRIKQKEVFVKDGTRKVSEENYLYDEFGHIISKSVKPYYSNEELVTTATYSSDGRYLKTETNAMGFSTTYEYDVIGKITSKTDHKNHTTRYDYDLMGNLTATIYPDSVKEINTIAWSDVVSGAVYSIRKTSTVEPTTITHYNALGMDLRNTVIRFDGKQINTDKIYYSNGSLFKESLPFTGASASQWNTYEYDVYDRLTKINFASGKIIGYDYQPGRKIVETKDGITTTKEYDGTENLVKVTDPAGTINYTYWLGGKPLEIKITGNLVTSFKYDNYGRQIEINDPSSGKTTYGYDEYGNRNSVTNANGEINIMSYDKFGRVLSVERPEFNTAYTYNDDGKIASEESTNGTSKTYEYDDLGRTFRETESYYDTWFQRKYDYVDGRLDAKSYLTSNQGPVATENYTYANGYLTEIKLNDQTSIWKLIEESEQGQPAKVETGTLSRTYSYTPLGMPTGRTVFNGTGIIQNFSYNFDQQKGNLLSRTDNTRRLTENFGYDHLNRLNSINGNLIIYANNGNITGMPEVGSMKYEHSDKPYTVTELSYTGDLVSTKFHDVSYTSFQRPKYIYTKPYMADMEYNAGGDRVRMYICPKGPVDPWEVIYQERMYFGEYEIHDNKEILYLGGDAYSASAVLVKENSYSPWKIHYICRDYLGSITHTTYEDGTLREEMSYDAWGRMRDPETQTLYQENTNIFYYTLLGRGYTGHEHIPYIGLINMNARLYDPMLGRFLSPDRYVQAPDNIQGFNRYSYCLNNPLYYVDQNGEFWFIVGGLLIGAYIGASLKSKSMNPAKWSNDWWKGALIGGAAGALTGGAIGAMWTAGATISIGASGFGINIPLITFTPATAMIGGYTTMAIGSGLGLGSGLVVAFDKNKDEQNQNFSPDSDPLLKAYMESKQESEEVFDWKTLGSISASQAAEMKYSERAGTWMGKNGKNYNMNWGGNQYTGGRGVAKNSAKNLGKVAMGLGLWSIGESIHGAFTGENSAFGAVLDTGFGIYSTFGGGYGIWTGVFYELGKEYGPIHRYLENRNKFVY